MTQTGAIYPSPDIKKDTMTASAESRPAASHDDVEEREIRARSGWQAINWREMWLRRELLYFLVWRDIKVRYKQTVMGVAWSVLMPLVTMLIFSLVFGVFVKIPTDDTPYPLFVFTGLLPWLFFSVGVTLSAASLINQHNLMTKVYFPRIFVPTACVGISLVDTAISFVILLIVMAFYGKYPGWGFLALPGLFVLTLAATLGLGYLLSALTVTYRDFRFVVPFLLQAWLYLSPVIYPPTVVPGHSRPWAALNPMSGLIENYRAAFLGKPWNLHTLAISAVTALGLFVAGLLAFRHMERSFADIA